MNPMEASGLTVVIPVYNEAAAINSAISRMKAICAANPHIEVIFINDGSTDGSERALAELRGESFRVIHHPHNRGYGASLMSGIRAASHDDIAITDADDTYPDHRIPEFHQKMKEHSLDMLVGARIGANAHIPAIRKPAKWMLNQLANHLSEYSIPDLNSGFRFMKKTAVLRFANILPSGFSFTTTITLAMLTNGLAVEYEPIEYAHRSGSSKIRPIQDTMSFIQLICRTILYFNPLRIFLPMSGMLAGAAVLVLLLSWLFTPRIMDVTFGTLLMTAVNILAVGLLADLIDKRL